MTLRIALISDTHGAHRSLQLPEVDVLIHAGDFCLYGRKEDAIDFNDWLGSLNIPLKIVINGNHDHSTWKSETQAILSHAIFLKNESYTIIRENGPSIKIFGTDFCWPMRKGDKHPVYESIDKDVNIIVTHCPVQGYVDCSQGCPVLAKRCDELSKYKNLKLVVCGHIHAGYGIMKDKNQNITYANAANCRAHGTISNSPILLTY